MPHVMPELTAGLQFGVDVSARYTVRSLSANDTTESLNYSSTGQ